MNQSRAMGEYITPARLHSEMVARNMPLHTIDAANARVFAVDAVPRQRRFVATPPLPEAGPPDRRRREPDA